MIQGRTWKVEALFSRNTLKVLAMAVMWLDHSAVALIGPFLSVNADSSVWHFLYWLHYSMRMAGRLAFPIFAFFLVEGFFYTRSKKRYALRLLLFALTAELPFNLALYGTIGYLWHQNTLFTLFLGLIMLVVLSRTSSFLIKVAVIGWSMVLSLFLQCDYGPMGIGLIALFYFFYWDKRASLVLGGSLCFLDSLKYGGMAAMACVLLYGYDRKKEPNTRITRLYYLFYPGHLIILVALRHVLSGLLV